MSDMYITQAVGSRNYSLHWRDGHGTWAGNHSGGIPAHPTVLGYMAGNHTTMPARRTIIAGVWGCILPRVPAMIVRTGTEHAALQLGHRFPRHCHRIELFGLGNEREGPGLHLDHILHVVLPTSRHWA